MQENITEDNKGLQLGFGKFDRKKEKKKERKITNNRPFLFKN